MKAFNWDAAVVGHFSIIPTPLTSVNKTFSTTPINFLRVAIHNTLETALKEIALNLVGPKSVKLAISDASVLYVVIVFPVFLAVHFPVIISFTILMFTCVSFPSCPCV